jgi:hypothetical protein
VIVMKDGNLSFDGDPEDLFKWLIRRKSSWFTKHYKNNEIY